MNKLFTIIILLLPLVVFAQLPLSNNGGLISIKDGAFLSAHGDVILSNNGVIHNSDTIYLHKNWVNNAGNEGFNSVGEGIVILNGDNQRIQGTDTTRFYELRHQATGIKYADLGVYVDGFLRLKDREFNLDTFTVHVFNTDLDAVTQQGGFVSSLVDGGLLRHTLSDQPYSFPLGSSLGVSRFRPVDLRLSSSSVNVFKVRMANVDASSDNFDRSLKDSIICQINPDFYHRIYQLQGTDSAQVSVHYDVATDGVWDSLAHWQNDPKWELTGDVSSGNNAAYGLDFVSSVDYISDFSNPAFALANVGDSIVLQALNNPVCEGDSFVFTAEPGLPSYDFYLNELLVQSGTSNTYSNILQQGDQVFVVVQTADCIRFSRPLTANIFTNTIALTASMLAVCAEETVVFTADNGFINYDFQINGVSVQNGTQNTFSTSTLTNGDLVTVIGTDANCAYESNVITIQIYQNQVDLTVDNLIACEEDDFNFEATAGFNNYEFLVNGISVQNGPDNVLAIPLQQFDIVQVIATDDNCIYESGLVQVTIYMNVLNLVVDMPAACQNDAFTFFASSGYDNYDFFVNGTLVQSGTNYSMTSNTLQDGDVITVAATDEFCTYTSDPVSISIYQNSIDLSTDVLEKCAGESFSFTATSGFNNYDFYVNFTLVQSTANPVFTSGVLPDDAVIYVIGTDDFCSYQSQQIQISFFENALLLESDAPLVCEGQSITFTASMGFNQYEFFLNGGSVQLSASNIFTANDLQTGDVMTLIGTDDNCTYESNPVIVNISTAVVELTSSAAGVCVGESLTFSANAGFDSYDFYVNNSLIQSSNSTTYTTTDWAANDSIFVIATLGDCQFESTTIGVAIYAGIQITAEQDTTIFFGNSTPLAAFGADFYSWSPAASLDCADCATVLASPDITTTYQVIGESLEGCLDTASVVVTVLQDNEGVFIPDAFTPNDDGKNDTWHISYLDAFPDNEVVVINRWGDRIFVQKPYTEEFDGRFQGAALPRGTYYYIIKVNVNGEERLFKGPLTIVR